MISIRVLGPLIISVDGQELRSLPKKSQALVGYLATRERGTIPREKLADLLWPDRDTYQARHSLRNSLLIVRKVLGPAVGSDISSVWLDRSVVEVDLDFFQSLSESPEIEELSSAANLYRDDFLADLTIISEPFQQWVYQERTRLCTAACELLQRLSIAQANAGLYRTAIQTGRKLIELDRLSEDGHRTLMCVYAHCGQRPAALRQFKECVDILKRDLGVAPDPETEALAQKIKRGEITPGSDRSQIRWPARTDRPPRDSFVLVEPLENDRGASPVALPRPPAKPMSADDPEFAIRSAGAQAWPQLPRLSVQIAALRNLTGDCDEEYLIEGFTDDLITDITKFGRSFNVSRASASSPDLLSDFDVHCLVLGSAQRGPGTLRLNIQLIDATTGQFLWADRYECERMLLPDHQAEITQRISRELHLILVQEASRRILSRGPIELEPPQLVHDGLTLLRRKAVPETVCHAQTQFLRALALEPRNVDALSALAYTYQIVMSQPWWAAAQASISAYDLGRESAGAALSYDPQHAFGHLVNGMIQSGAGEIEQAAKSFDNALAANPNLAGAHAFGGLNAAFLGNAADTLPAVERAFRLAGANPALASFWFFFAGFGDLLLGRADEATNFLRKSLDSNPSYGSAQLWLACAQSIRGDKDQASLAVSAFQKRYPSYGLSAFARQWVLRSKHPTYRMQVEPVFQCLQRLGLSD